VPVCFPQQDEKFAGTSLRATAVARVNHALRFFYINLFCVLVITSKISKEISQALPHWALQNAQWGKPFYLLLIYRKNRNYHRNE